MREDVEMIRMKKRREKLLEAVKFLLRKFLEVPRST